MDEDAFEYNATPVHEAAKGNHLQCLNVLVKHSGAVNGVDEGGNTPLLNAAYNEHIDSLIFLILNDCPPEAWQRSRMQSQWVMWALCDVYKYKFLFYTLELPSSPC